MCILVISTSDVYIVGFQVLNGAAGVFISVHVGANVDQKINVLNCLENIFVELVGGCV